MSLIRERALLGDELWLEQGRGCNAGDRQEAGTLFFKEGSRPDPDEDDYGDYIVDHVGNIYNRIVLFRGKYLPHRSNIAGFGNSLETGRLSQHFFFNEVK